MIHVEQLTKQYGPTLAVDGISFDVGRREVVGFLGPNGAGKSTTMRILTGYLSATAGRAAIDGHDVFDDSLEVRRRIGYLPEGVPLYPEMRVSEYLRYRAQIKGVPRKERAARVEAALERCDLRDVRRKLIGNLSKGFRQRVGLADALVHDPPVLILDEPTIGLDPHQVRQVRQLIRDLGADHTILLSTHILSEVEMICGRVIIICQGKLVYQDRLAEIATHGAGGVRVIVEARLPESAQQAGADALAAIPGVRSVNICSAGALAGQSLAAEAGWLRFELQVDPSVDVREEVFRRASAAGWTLRELRREQHSLEEIFVRLTAREADDA